MRKIVMLALLGPVVTLAGCGENAGWNPNYSSMNNGSAYAKYLGEREAALHGRAPLPQVIPIKTPAQAPTAQDISGVAPSVTVQATAAQVPQNPQVVTSGHYPGSVPVLTSYAYQERQNPGVSTYQRTGGSIAAAARLCSNYASGDIAQRAFIASGGPVIDPRGMDPDGDGFVCGWDPRPLRQSGL